MIELLRDSFTILPLYESHNGKPETISNSIAPKLQMSIDQGNSFFDKSIEPEAKFADLESRYSKRSGAKYSGVVSSTS